MHGVYIAFPTTPQGKLERVRLATQTPAKPDDHAPGTRKVQEPEIPVGRRRLDVTACSRQGAPWPTA